MQLSVFVVLAALAAVNCKEILVNLDKGVSNHCGKVFVLSPSNDVRLQASGLAPDGYCGVSVFTPSEVNNYTCDALCVTFKRASVSVCDVKLKLVGHRFGSSDYVKEFTCHQRDTEPFCWPVTSVRVEVIESYVYAYKEQKANYEFDVDVSARCTKDPQEREYYSRQKELDDAEHKTFVEGIAVGVSLACVFLIVLFIAWCYTKHQAVSGTPSDSTPRTASNTHRKGNIITTFRKKLTFKRKSQGDAEEPEAVYRKTETPHAATQSARETTPLTKDPEPETYELANETIEANAEGEGATGQDSPKDGGADTTALDTPEVVISAATPEPSEVDSN